MYELPMTATVGGRAYPIRSDFRPILDILQALVDPELTQEEKAYVALQIFYPEDIPEDMGEALKECFRFIGLGQLETDNNGPKLMDWGQDFPYIVAPINRVMGGEIRSMPYVHWWTFISAYYEIGDCTFAQIVRIRDMKARGKKLDKEDARWYKEHRDIVDIKTHYTEAEQDLLKKWGV